MNAVLETQSERDAHVQQTSCIVDQHGYDHAFEAVDDVLYLVKRLQRDIAGWTEANRNGEQVPIDGHIDALAAISEWLGETEEGEDR